MQNNSNVVEINGVSVETARADKVLRWLIRAEAENVRTKATGDVQMIKEIQKHIKEEVERR